MNSEVFAEPLLQRDALFVLGTGTGVGKTIVSRTITQLWKLREREVCSVKPLEAGSTPGPDGEPHWGDAASHWECCSARGRSLLVEEGVAAREPYLGFPAAIAPWTASQLAGAPIVFDELAGWLRSLADRCRQENVRLLAEGAGGVLVPLTEKETIADLARESGLPVLLVGVTELGTINHTLLSVEALERRGVEMAGVVLSRERGGPWSLAEEAGFRELGEYLRGRAPVLAVAGPATELEVAPLLEPPPPSWA